MNAFQSTQNYQYYVACLRQLHQLIRSGQEDSEIADELRDRMDDYWAHLSAEQITHVRQISADLHTLSADETDRPTEMSPPVAKEVRDAFSSGDSARLLRVLRELNGAIPEHVGHYLRFTAYKELGDADVALDFGFTAIQLMPQDRRYVQLVIGYLTTLGRYQDALGVADDFTPQTGSDAEENILKGCLVFQITRGMSDDEKAQACRRAIEILKPALSVAREDPLVSPAAVRQGYLTLAFCYERLGDLDQTMRAFGDLLDLDPDNAEAIAWRGLLTHNSDPDAAAADIERAVELHCETTALPYMIVALSRLNRGDFEQALEISMEGQRLAHNPQTRAQLLHWAAIAMHNVGRPLARVQSTFQRAISLDPLNDLIKYNYEIFISSTVAQPQPHAAFTMPQGSQIVEVDARGSQLEAIQYGALAVA